ncbi:hypothetical protein EYB45_09550 [Erythrobacteraceae bacterium CFH 75059]|uniref:hypothetical protein n=1 Tax=Qipengyuania thermophila TaxID=2509361 RepID=UPI00101ECDED|nr:hypothetical protein [Qipengyuania thermophila]TCD02220.1 hypothetical protein EYB45_09550 [Erythrobacteraceae bacterium CFH 75059]
MEPQQLRGVIPGNTNSDFIYLTGAVISWWARIEGIMTSDVMALRTWPFSAEIVDQKRFPLGGRDTVLQWRALIINAYKARNLSSPNLDKIVTDSLQLLWHRNCLSHSFWPYGQQEKSVLELHWIKRKDSNPQGIERGTYRVTATELDKVNTRLANLCTAALAASFNSHIVYRDHGA